MLNKYVIIKHNDLVMACMPSNDQLLTKIDLFQTNYVGLRVFRKELRYFDIPRVKNTAKLFLKDKQIIVKDKHNNCADKRSFSQMIRLNLLK